MSEENITNVQENASDYNEDQIQVLEGLEAVRKRPGMYIGSTSQRGLHHLVWKLLIMQLMKHLLVLYRN